jgi:hypothetical protein
MNIKISRTCFLLILFAAGCTTTNGEINSFKESGECRMAENLIMEKYSGQEQLYNVAMVNIECDGEKDKGLKTLQTLAAGDYMPAMARLIEFNATSSQMIRRYNTLKSAAEEAAYERKEAYKQWLLSHGQTTTVRSSERNRPMQVDNRCIKDGGYLMCYNPQRYGRY